jgi:hypothetical protein
MATYTVEISKAFNTRTAAEAFMAQIRKGLEGTEWQNLRVYLDVEQYNDSRYDCCTVPE